MKNQMKTPMLFVVLFALMFAFTGCNSGSTDESGNPIVPTPTITVISFTPTTATKGDTITITGSNFSNSTVSSVTIGGVNASIFSVVNSTTIKAVVPTGATSGSVRVNDATATSGSFVFASVTRARFIRTVIKGVDGVAVLDNNPIINVKDYWFSNAFLYSNIYLDMSFAVTGDSVKSVTFYQVTQTPPASGEDLRNIQSNRRQVYGFVSGDNFKIDASGQAYIEFTTATLSNFTTANGLNTVFSGEQTYQYNVSINESEDTITLTHRSGTVASATPTTLVYRLTK